MSKQKNRTHDATHQQIRPSPIVLFGQNLLWAIDKYIFKMPLLILTIIVLLTTTAIFLEFWQWSPNRIFLTALFIGLVFTWTLCFYIRHSNKRSGNVIHYAPRAWIPEMVPRFPKYIRRLATTGMFLISFTIFTSALFLLYQRSARADNIVILVANFQGEDEEKYRVTETVLAQLSHAFSPYDDVKIEVLSEAITEGQGSDYARERGRKRNADIVIWGWYSLTEEVAAISVHFELLYPPYIRPGTCSTAAMNELASNPSLTDVLNLQGGRVRPRPLAELESFTLQTQLSQELAYLSLFSVGMARYSIGHWQGAIDNFDAALALGPHQAELDKELIYLFRGNAYYSQGELDKAMADYERVIGHQGPTALVEAIRADPKIFSAYNNRAYIQYEEGNIDGAIADLNLITNYDTSFAPAYFNRGRIYYEQDKFDIAIGDFDRYIELDNASSCVYSYRGAARKAKGDMDGAMADYNQAIVLFPQNGSAYHNRGAIYETRGDHEAALREYNQAIAGYTWVLSINPEDSVTYYYRGLTHRAKEDHDAALKDYDQAIRLDPDYVEAYLERGDTYTDKGDYDAALRDYNQATILEPDSEVAYYSRGRLHLIYGEFDKAIEDYNRTLELDPLYYNAYHGRGLAYAHLGQKDKAKADLETFLSYETDPYWREQTEQKLEELKGD